MNNSGDISEGAEVITLGTGSFQGSKIVIETSSGFSYIGGDGTAKVIIMIAKYEKQAIRTTVQLVVALVVARLCVGLAMAMKEPSVALGIFLALAVVGAAVAMLILYFRACFFLARAKGYSMIVFLLILAGPLVALIPKMIMVAAVVEVLALPLTLLFLEDKSNPAKEAEEEKYQGGRCVCCNIRILPTLKICPKCSWTQPVADVPETA